MQLPTIRLNSKADYRIRNGHLWIYSNEVNNKVTDLSSLQPGDQAIIENANGQTLGVAYINPNTLICGRMISKNPAETINLDLLTNRITLALNIRNRIFDSNCYRLVYGESDLLPGLVIDRFLDLIVIQISTAGMERHLDLIVTAIDQIIQPKAILVKNDGKMREVEGLSSYVIWKKGHAQHTALLEENNVKFLAPIVDGQKTGWFYDHRMIRARLKDYVKNKRVLDVFSYIGGWGIQAAAFGASEVVLNDCSDFALECALANAKLNNLQNIKTIKGDAFEVMQDLIAEKQNFDVVILDPPAFIPRRKDLHKGIAAYQKANMLAMRLLSAAGGILVSGSCSMHLPVVELHNAIYNAARKLGKQVQILEQGHQGPDHPIHPAIPETEYLKSVIAHVY